jgi:hypothetical protein
MNYKNKKGFVHIMYLVIIMTLWAVKEKKIVKFRKNYYREIVKSNYNMREWSQCLWEKADTLEGKTNCDNALWDLRQWLRQCKCKCTGKMD